MMGRLRIQVFGFLGVGTCFIISAAAFHPLTTPGGKSTFQFLYFFSSFLVGRCASALQGLMRDSISAIGLGCSGSLRTPLCSGSRKFSFADVSSAAAQ